MAFAALKGSIELDESGLEKGVDNAGDSLDDLESRTEAVGSQMTRVGAGMTAGLTLPLAGMATQSARTAASFEQNMQESIAVMGSVSDSMREDLEQTAEDVASSTTVSASEAAEAYYFLSSAGLDASQAMEAMPQVAAFAEAGQMDMAEATDVATNVMSAYGLEAENMSEVTDVMTETVTSHNQTMEGMSSAFRNAAPAAASMGVEIEELAALTGALGDVGIQAEEAGTALNSMMRRMSKRSGEAGQALDELGIQTTDANGELLPMIDIIEQLEEANMSSAQASQIFGRQMSAGSALVEQGADSLRDYQGNLEDADGATEDVAETQRESFNAEMQMAQNEISNAGIAIGQDLLPYLSILVNTVSDGADAFGDLSSGQQTTIVAIGGLIAVIGPLLAGIGFLATNAAAGAAAIGSLGGMATTAGGLISGTLLPASVAGSGGLTGLAAAALAANVALGPITVPIWAIVAAIAALGAGVVAFAAAYRKNWMSVRDYTEWAISPILSGIDMFVGAIFGISDATGKVGDSFADFLDWIISAVNKLPGVDIGGDGLGFNFETDMGDADTDELSEEMSAEDMMPEGYEEELAEQTEDGVSEGASDGMASGIVDGLEKSDVQEHFEEKLADAQERRSNTYGDEFNEAREEAVKLEGIVSDLEDAESLADVDSDIAAEAAQAELDAEIADEEQRLAIAEIVGEDFESDVDIDAELESLEQGLSEELDRELTTQQDQHKTLQKIREEIERTRNALETLRLRVNMDLNSREFNKIIDDRVEAGVEDTVK